NSYTPWSTIERGTTELYKCGVPPVRVAQMSGP
ncbi:MAG: hypothetical protein ACI82G_001222, partial [Bradymonadia bacterium]